MALRCKSCGAVLRDEDRFCPHCGTKVTMDCCPVCGSSIQPGDMYCGICGHYLKGDEQNRTVQNPSSSGAEREIPPVTGAAPDPVPDPATALADRDSQEAGIRKFIRSHRLSLRIAVLEMLIFVMLSPVHDVTSIAFSQVLGYIVGTSLVYMIGVIPFAFSLKKWGVCTHSHIGLWFLGTCDVLVLLARAGMLRAANGGPAIGVVVIGILSLILVSLHRRHQKRRQGRDMP